MDNKVTLTLEFDISQAKRGWDEVVTYGSQVKQQINGLFVNTDTFKPFSEMNTGTQLAGVGVDQLTAKVQKLEQQLEKARSKTVGGAGLPQFTQLSGNARMAVSSLNYTLQDSGMFFVNWRMGMMSISNNIPMLLQGLKGMKTEADAANKSFKNYIFDSFSGPNSILIWISLFSMAMVALPQLLDSTTESAEKQKKAIDELRDAYKKLTGAELQSRLSTYNSQLAELESKHPSKRAGRYSSGTSIGGLAPGNISSDEYTVTGEARFGSDYAQVQSLQKRIELLKETLLDLGKEEDVEKRIRLNREKLEKMNENPESKNYWKKLVPDSTSYNNARVLLDKWIEADEKIYGKDKKQKDKKIPTAQELFDQEMERVLPGSVYEALLPLAEKDIDELKDVEIMSDSEIHKLKIMNIENEWERKRQLADWEVEAAKEKYKDYINYNEIIAEYEKQAEIRKKEINLEEQKDLEKKFEVQKRMFEDLASFGRDELINMFDDAFSAGETFAGRFFSKLLSMILDRALSTGIDALFSMSSQNSSGTGLSLWNLLPLIPLAKTTSGNSAGAQLSTGSINSQAILNKVTTPGNNEIRVVVSQSRMADSVTEALNKWGDNVQFKFAYDEFRAGIKKYDHRKGFEY